MKRHFLIILVAAVMAMCPVLVFAGTEAFAQDETAQADVAQTDADQTEDEADPAEGEEDPTEGEEDPAEEPVIPQGWNEDRTVYYLEDGSAATGFFWAENADGKEKLYYATKNGVVKTAAGWIFVNGNKYRVTKNGNIRTQEGVFLVEGDRYIIPKGAVNGAVRRKVGPVKFDGVLYYVRSTNGKLGVHKAYKLNDKTYHVTAKGVVITGKHLWKDNKYYYSLAAGNLRKTATMVVVGNNRFHVKKGGLVTVNAKFKYKGNYYIARKKGNVYTGIFKWNKTLYYASSKGILKAKAGIVTFDNKDYFVAKGGKVYVNKMITSNGKKYCAKSDGTLRKGVFEFGGKYYYAKTDHTIRTTAKVIKYGGKYYFNKKGGGLARNKFVEFDGKFYYAGDNAAFLTSTFNMKGVTFHPSAKGELPEEEYRKLYPIDDDDDDY